MSERKQTRNATYLLIGLVCVMLVIPRLLPEFELSRGSLLWYPVGHQLLLASIIGLLVWRATGHKRRTALLITALIIVVWGPNLAGAIEYSWTGRNTTVLSISERLGVTPLLNTVYPFLYDSLGYSITVAHS
ncbi:hypothetical protein [Roseiconus lacunae]|uniref:Uncharacterized protein n=1 Tax=Roseiconus lacunae TaxID=2605694 RepID=A0ABT7PSW1_9BACT|nr:hypothetical protein [Roseiconus lacunae]MDM4019588.1 hypothetical protein [Roseiconus lacunae]